MRPFCTWSLFLELSVRSEFVNTSLKALVIFSSVTREELFLIAKNSDITNMAFTPWLKINFQPWDRIALTNTHLMFSLSAIFDTPTGDFSYIIQSKKPKHCFVVEPTPHHFKTLQQNLMGYPVSFIKAAITDKKHLVVDWDGQTNARTLTFSEQE